MKKSIYKKIFFLSLTIFFITASFSACKSSRSSGDGPKKRHSYTTLTETIAPTCTQEGKNVYQCWCGDYLEESVPALGHKYIETICETCEQNMIDELTYTLSEDGSYYSLSGLGNYSAPSLTVPDSYKGLPVKEIGKETFKYSSNKIINVRLGDSITSIAENAFFGSYIRNITLGNGLVYIGNYAFSGCSITNINLPQSLISMGQCAFADSDLISIEIPDQITRIEADTFALCDSLQFVIIGNSVTSIGENAFHQCTMLKNVIIGEKVTSIETSAFYNCTSLTNVYFNGTATAWNSIAIGKDNTWLTNATIHLQAK